MESSSQASEGAHARFKPYSALWIVLNEYSEVVLFKLLRTKSNDEVRPLVALLRQRFDEAVRVVSGSVILKIWSGHSTSRRLVHGQLLPGPRVHHPAARVP